MGWWRAGEDGSSLHLEETGLAWGDGPADIMDEAIDEIAVEFRKLHGRRPTAEELMGGLKAGLMEPNELPWGDPCADIMARAIADIRGDFADAWDRWPTRTEMVGGLLFSLGAYDEEE